MTAYQLFSLPRQTNIDSSVRVTPGALAHFYATTTTTPQDTYTDAALTIPSANPVVADANGVFQAIYLDPTLIYKLTLTTSAGVLIYSVDPVNDQVLSALAIGRFLYPLSSAEQAAGLDDSDINDFSKVYGDVRRYGAACDGITDDTVAINNGADAVRAGLAANLGGPNVLLFGSGTCKVSGSLDFSGIGVDGGAFSLDGGPHIRATSAQFNVITSTGRTVISNLYVDGGWNGSTAGLSGDTMSFIDPIDGTAYDIYLSNVALLNNKKRGIYWEGGAYGFVDRPQIGGCGLHAVELYSVDPGHTTTTIGFTGKGTMSSTPNGYGLKITACVSISVDTIIMEATKGILVAGSGNRTLSFDRIYQESSVGTTFLDLGSSDGIGLSVTNCFGNTGHITEASNWNNVHFDSNSLAYESSIYAAGRYVISDSGELTTATTGGTSFTAGTLALAPGTWLINSTMQMQDAGGSTAVKAGIKITATVGDSGLNINTNVNFTEGCDEATNFGASQDARLHAWQLYQNTTGAAVNIYLRGFINISAGTIAYRGYSTAVKLQ